MMTIEKGTETDVIVMIKINIDVKETVTVMIEDADAQEHLKIDVAEILLPTSIASHQNPLKRRERRARKFSHLLKSQLQSQVHHLLKHQIFKSQQHLHSNLQLFPRIIIQKL